MDDVAVSDGAASAAGSGAHAASRGGNVLAAAVAGYAFAGVDLMVVTLSLPLLLEEWKITMIQGGTIVSVMLIGSCIGGYLFGPIADRFGRKKALMGCIAYFGIATGLGGLSQDYVQLCVLRFLAGFGLGAEWALGATMVAEFYPIENRASANSWMQMGWPLGHAVAIGAQYVLITTMGLSWRALYFAGSLAVLVAVYIAIFVPESPVWLEARAAERRRAVMEPASASGSAAKTWDLFRGENRRSFAWATVIMTCTLMAYWAVNTWLPTILPNDDRMGGVKGVSIFLLALQAVAIPALYAAGRVADKLGKRPVTVVSALLSAITLYVWHGFPWSMSLFWFWGIAHWGMASCLWASLGAYMAEQFPTEIRASGLSSASANGRVVVVAVPMALGAAAAGVEPVYVIAIVAVLYLIASIACFMLRETRAGT